MKKGLFLLAGIIMLLSSCSKKVERINSINQVDALIHNHIGVPVKIDTMFADSTLLVYSSSILYDFDSNNVSFEQMLSLLEKAYDCKSVIENTSKSKMACFVYNPNIAGGIYTAYLQENEDKEGIAHLSFWVIDVNNELIPPSSPAPQTVAPSK